MKNINFENLTNEEKLVISMKESLRRYKSIEELTEEKAFYGALIGKIASDMKKLGIYDKYFN